MEVTVTVAGIATATADRLSFYGFTLLHHLAQTLHVDHHIIFRLSRFDLDDIRHLRLLTSDKEQTESCRGIDGEASTGSRGVLLHETIFALQAVDGLYLVFRDVLRLVALTRQPVEGSLGFLCLLLCQQRIFHTLTDILSVVLIMHSHLTLHSDRHHLLSLRHHRQKHHRQQGQEQVFHAVAHFII